MTIDDALLFIDANKYLDLYRTKTGKLSLAALSQQVHNIFVTQKVVDEVKRNKIKETAVFLTKQFKELAKTETYNVPDHLFGATEEQSKSIIRQMKEIGQKIELVNRELRALGGDIMTKVSQSVDEVSTALAPIFANAERHSDVELQRGKERKERGDPPGKQTDPIGDQVTWEQILFRFVGKTKLWIITRDSDYGSMYGGKGFLNQLLYEELLKVSPGAEAFLFDNVPEGIKHFADVMGVPADKVPTSSQIKEIKEEEETLPPPRRLDLIYEGQRAAFYDAHPLYSRQSIYDARSSFDLLGRPLPITSFGDDVKAAAPVFDPLGRPLPNPATESQ